MSSPIDKALALAKEQRGEKLQLTVAGKTMDVGSHVPKADTQKPPELSISTPSGGPYVVIAADADAPFRSFSVLGPILHWTQSGLEPSQTAAADGFHALSASDTPSVAHWVPAGPPPLSGPHRYVFMLYNQPAEFDATKFAPPSGQKVGVGKRMRYDIGQFVKDAKLGEMVAANYFESH